MRCHGCIQLEVSRWIWEREVKCKNEPKTGDTSGLIFHINGVNEALKAKVTYERKIQIKLRSGGTGQ